MWSLGRRSAGENLCAVSKTQAFNSRTFNEEHVLGTSWGPENHLSFRFLAYAEGSGGRLQPRKTYVVFIAEKRTRDNSSVCLIQRALVGTLVA